MGESVATSKRPDRDDQAEGVLRDSIETTSPRINLPGIGLGIGGRYRPPQCSFRRRENMVKTALKIALIVDEQCVVMQTRFPMHGIAHTWYCPKRYDQLMLERAMVRGVVD
jgi:hypothetical protein